MILPRFTAIAACASNGVMGKGGKLPWSYPEDLNHFYRSTEGGVMLMGYNTFSSLPARAFQDRTCVILTKNHRIDPFISVRSLGELEKYYQTHPELLKKTNFVIGGAAVFDLFFSKNLIDSAVITHIHKDYEGDVHFPLHFMNHWHKKTVHFGLEFTIIRHTKNGN